MARSPTGCRPLIVLSLCPPYLRPDQRCGGPRGGGAHVLRRGTLTKKSGKIFRVGIFLDFVWLTTRTPHGAYVRRARRNRFDRHGGGIERLALQGGGAVGNGGTKYFLGRYIIEVSGEKGDMGGTSASGPAWAATIVEEPTQLTLASMNTDLDLDLGLDLDAEGATVLGLSGPVAPSPHTGTPLSPRLEGEAGTAGEASESQGWKVEAMVHMATDLPMEGGDAPLPFVRIASYTDASVVYATFPAAPAPADMPVWHHVTQARKKKRQYLPGGHFS